jgi:hypothetical protein
VDFSSFGNGQAQRKYGGAVIQSATIQSLLETASFTNEPVEVTLEATHADRMGLSEKGLNLVQQGTGGAAPQQPVPCTSR